MGTPDRSVIRETGVGPVSRLLTCRTDDDIPIILLELGELVVVLMDIELHLERLVFPREAAEMVVSNDRKKVSGAVSFLTKASNCLLPEPMRGRKVTTPASRPERPGIRVFS
jgi:hypothetical protein